jgi:hypothetical protein
MPCCTMLQQTISSITHVFRFQWHSRHSDCVMHCEVTCLICGQGAQGESARTMGQSPQKVADLPEPASQNPLATKSPLGRVFAIVHERR